MSKKRMIVSNFVDVFPRIYEELNDDIKSGIYRPLDDYIEKYIDEFRFGKRVSIKDLKANYVKGRAIKELNTLGLFSKGKSIYCDISLATADELANVVRTLLDNGEKYISNMEQHVRNTIDLLYQNPKMANGQMRFDEHGNAVNQPTKEEVYELVIKYYRASGEQSA